MWNRDNTDWVIFQKSHRARVLLSDIPSKLRCPEIFHPLTINTVRFRMCFLPYCLNNLWIGGGTMRLISTRPIQFHTRELQMDTNSSVFPPVPALVRPPVLTGSSLSHVSPLKNHTQTRSFCAILDSLYKRWHLLSVLYSYMRRKSLYKCTATFSVMKSCSGILFKSFCYLREAVRSNFFAIIRLSFAKIVSTVSHRSDKNENFLVSLKGHSLLKKKHIKIASK